jgi:2-polyprenyl-3-methyl-5-hydroxy-6-metoxy-1,4-benzoquinol methylase
MVRETLYALVNSADMTRIIDIGCGIGTWLHYAQQRGSHVFGFESSSDLVEYGIDKFGLSLSSEIFTAENPLAIKEQATLLTCVMVFQHLSDPRTLAESISAYCCEHKAKAFVSVPFFNHDKHSWLLKQDGFENSISNDVGAHVTYFSDRGIEIMFNDFGLKVERFCPQADGGGVFSVPHDKPRQRKR